MAEPVPYTPQEELCAVGDGGLVEDANQWLQCSSEYIEPVLNAIYPIAAVAVLIAILFAGIRVSKRTVKAFYQDV